jgi:hypothetical protein
MKTKKLVSLALLAIVLCVLLASCQPMTVIVEKEVTATTSPASQDAVNVKQVAVFPGAGSLYRYVDREYNIVCYQSTDLECFEID